MDTPRLPKVYMVGIIFISSNMCQLQVSCRVMEEGTTEIVQLIHGFHLELLGKSMFFFPMILVMDVFSWVFQNKCSGLAVWNKGDSAFSGHDLCLKIFTSPAKPRAFWKSDFLQPCEIMVLNDMFVARPKVWYQKICVYCILYLYIYIYWISLG